MSDEYNSLPGMDSAKTLMCIVARILRKGDGKETPVRIVTQVFTTEGELIAESDPGACISIQDTCKDAIELIRLLANGNAAHSQSVIDAVIKALKVWA